MVPMDGSGIFSAVLDWFHKAPFYAMATAIITAVLLLIGNSAADWLGLHEYRAWISAAFLISITVFIAQVLSASWSWGSGVFAKGLADKERNGRLHTLTPGEISILKVYLEHKRRTFPFAPDKTSVESLAHAGIITELPLPSGYSRIDRSYLLAEWAWLYLHKHPSLVGYAPPVEREAGQNAK